MTKTQHADGLIRLRNAFVSAASELTRAAGPLVPRTLRLQFSRWALSNLRSDTEPISMFYAQNE